MCKKILYLIFLHGEFIDIWHVNRCRAADPQLGNTDLDDRREYEISQKISNRNIRHNPYENSEILS